MRAREEKSVDGLGCFSSLFLHPPVEDRILVGMMMNDEQDLFVLSFQLS